MSNVRKARLAQETSSSNRFALGDELKSLREDLESLRHNLEWARALKDEVRMQSLTKAIKNGQNRDPYFMYAKALRLMAEARKMKDASQEEKDALTDKWSNVADAARQVLPEFNLEGLAAHVLFLSFLTVAFMTTTLILLFLVSYGGKHGTQVVNITYTGDEMIATKCTGDKNVPRGEVTFTVNLEPSNASALPPIQLVSDHRKGEFRRFPGKGQVSRRGFKDHRYVEGQMILFENQFSFVWIPTKHHVLFHRPSPEQTLKLLRNTISKEDEIENMRGHLTRCFDMDLSTAIARQQHAVDLDEPLRRITTQEELEEAEKRVKETNRGNIFYQMSKWRDYIDHVLDNNK
ncbi:MAG: hypothetical protein SGILL_004992 [Bacillariaceae sp.]